MAEFMSVRTKGRAGELVVESVLHCVRLVEACTAYSGPLCPLTLKLKCPPTTEALPRLGGVTAFNVRAMVVVWLKSPAVAITLTFVVPETTVLDAESIRVPGPPVMGFPLKDCRHGGKGR
jgi:hypothetical protein